MLFFIIKLPKTGNKFQNIKIQSMSVQAMTERERAKKGKKSRRWSELSTEIE